MRSLNLKVNYENEKKSVQKQLIAIQNKVENMINDIQVRTQDLHIWAETKIKKN